MVDRIGETIIMLLKAALFWLGDILLSLLLLFADIFIVIFTVAFGFIWIPVTALAVLFMFVLKTSFVTRWYLKHESYGLAVALAAGATALAAMGSFGYIFIAMQYPEIKASFFSHYGNFPEVTKPSRYETRTAQVYYDVLADHIRYAKMWFFMTLKDGTLFFISLSITLSLQIYTAGRDKMIVRILYPLFILVLFVAVIYADDLFDYLSRLGLPAFCGRIVEHVRNEVFSARDLLLILLGAKQTTFAEWFYQEMVKMGGSIYKMAAIYPKLFLVFFVTNLAVSRKVEV